MESLDHLFSGPPVYLDSVEAVYGPTSRVVFPTVTREVWADMVRCFPGLRSVRYPSRGSYRVLSFRLDQLGDSEDSLHSTLIVRGHYARGRVRFDRESTREFSIYKDDTLVARTLVRGDHCAWLYLQDTILDQCHRCPVVLIKMPSLAKYLTQAQITEALMEWQDREKGAAGAQEVRVLNRRDHFFELAHHGQTRAAVVKKMVGHVKCFFAINCLLAPLAIATITLALLEQTTLDGAFPEAVGIAVREAPLHECHHTGCSHAHIPLAPHVPGERERARGLHPGRCLRLRPPARRSQA